MTGEKGEGISIVCLLSKDPYGHLPNMNDVLVCGGIQELLDCLISRFSMK